MSALGLIMTSGAPGVLISSRIVSLSTLQEFFTKVNNSYHAVNMRKGTSEWDGMEVWQSYLILQGCRFVYVVSGRSCSVILDITVHCLWIWHDRHIGSSSISSRDLPTLSLKSRVILNMLLQMIWKLRVHLRLIWMTHPMMQKSVSCHSWNGSCVIYKNRTWSA